MFVSKFFAKNFRSLKQVIIHLSKDKNVLVGKNNSGKSNVIRALDILLGEKFPSYQNITENDFYTAEVVIEKNNHHDEIAHDIETKEIKLKTVENVAQNFYIEAELTGKDFDEEKIKSIKKRTAFSKLKSIKKIYERDENDEIHINYDFLQNLDEIENRTEIQVLESYPSGKEKKSQWFDSVQLLEFLKTSQKIKLFFTKSQRDDSTGFGMIIQDAEGYFWISNYFTKKLRDSLLTTAVITSLRSPKEDLRLVYYTWFGRLIKNIWETNKTKLHPQKKKTYETLIIEKSLDIKEFVDIVFSENTTELRTLLEKAITHKSVSFKFLSDSKDEIYKNVEIFINDGIERPLSEKGTGIQSAIIIALFSQYCNKFHNTNSLLITEEPELFLHPQARRVVAAELDSFLNTSNKQQRQLIISTHSTEFLKNVDPANIIRIHKKGETNQTQAYQLNDDTSKQLLTNNIKRLIWSSNTEIFFADKVLLVEGGELYLIPSIIDCLNNTKQVLDYKNISIARINGKGNFLTYIKMLTEFNIDWVVLGDLDCYKEDVKKIVKYLELVEIEREVSMIQNVVNLTPTDYSQISKRVNGIKTNLDAQYLKNVFEKFINGIIERDNEDLLKIVEYMKSRYIEKSIALSIEENGLSKKFQNLQQILRNNNIFIWSKGELENYYTAEAQQVKGSKDIKALTLAYLISEDENNLDKYIENIDEFKELNNVLFR